MKMDKDLYIQIGFLLRLARQSKKMSLADAGDKVNKSKVSIKRYEDGDSRIDTPTFEKLCRLYGLDPEATLLEAKTFAGMVKHPTHTPTYETDTDPDRRFEVLTDDEYDLVTTYRKISDESKVTLLALAKNMK